METAEEAFSNPLEDTPMEIGPERAEVEEHSKEIGTEPSELQDKAEEPAKEKNVMPAEVAPEIEIDWCMWGLPISKEAVLELEGEDVPVSMNFLAEIRVPEEIAKWSRSEVELRVPVNARNNNRGSVVFDVLNNVVYEMSHDFNYGKDIVMWEMWDEGVEGGVIEGTVLKDVIPFETKCTPIFDGGRYVYVNGYGRKFGRFDLDTRSFEVLTVGLYLFGEFDGFCANNHVYHFRKEGKGMAYDVVEGTWSDTNIMHEGVCMIPHPLLDTLAIELMANGTVRHVNLENGEVVKDFEAQFGKFDGKPTAIAFRCSDDEYILMACSKSQKWKVFCSRTDTWNETDWECMRGETRSVFIDPRTLHMYYHINGDNGWSRVSPIKQDVVAKCSEGEFVFDKTTNFAQWTSKSVASPTGFSELRDCGTIFDPKRRMIVENSVRVNEGKDLFVTWFREDGSGETRHLRDKLPFKSYRRAVFDGMDHVYYQQLLNKKVVRMSLDTFELMTLPRAGSAFGETDGFFYEGCLYCFDLRYRAWKYDDENAWQLTPLKLNLASRAVLHPWNTGTVIEFTFDGFVREISISDGRFKKMYNSKTAETSLEAKQEALAVRAPNQEFFLFVCDSTGELPWRVFSSADDKWTETNILSTKAKTNAAFLDPATRHIFFHEEGHTTLSCMVNPQNENKLCEVLPAKDCGIPVQMDNRIFAMKTVSTKLKSGFNKTADGGGAVLDATRGLVIQTCSAQNEGKDISLTNLSDGTVNVHRASILFRTTTRPIYDGKRYVYFQQKGGTNFGMFDLEAMSFIELMRLDTLFGDFDGVFVKGSVLCFDNQRRAHMFNPEKKQWALEAKPISIMGVTMLAHPSNPDLLLEIMQDGTIREVYIENGLIVKAYRASCGKISVIPDVIALAARNGEFFLALCRGSENAPWMVFSSENDEWKEMDWASTNTGNRTVMFDPNTGALLYQQGGSETFTQATLES